MSPIQSVFAGKFVPEIADIMLEHVHITETDDKGKYPVLEAIISAWPDGVNLNKKNGSTTSTLGKYVFEVLMTRFPQLKPRLLFDIALEKQADGVIRGL